MKAICIKPLRADGCQFEKGKEYEFTEQVFTEEYTPAIHPVAPARGRRIRYMRYKTKRVVRWACCPCDRTETRDIYFYDHAYCLHHNYRDERGRETECFDDCFAVIRQPTTRLIKPRENPLVLKCPESIKVQMSSGYQDWLMQMMGGTEYE